MKILSLAAQAALLALVSAQQAPGIGGIIPATIATPNVTGFQDPTVQPARGGYAICVSGTVSVTASTNKQMRFNFTVPQNQTGTTQTFISFIAAGSPFMQQISEGTTTVNGTYDIQSTLCYPANNTSPQTVQFLTHGVGFDRYYWDFAPGYSYVDYAATRGYATFFYDRLGVGQSAKEDPVNVVQASLEVAIANTLAQMVRAGDFGGIRPKYVVGVGHSFGSIITEAVTSMSPSTFDAAVLTGFSMNQTGLSPFTEGLNLEIAALDQPYRFSGLNPGYLVGSSTVSNQIAFFNFPGFDPHIAAAANAQKGTVTYGELFTQGSVVAPAANFTGPVIIANGLEDLPFCLANCTSPSNKAQQALSALYPKAANSSTTYLAPNTGHGINLHYSAVSVYKVIQDFVQNNGV